MKINENPAYPIAAGAILALVIFPILLFVLNISFLTSLIFTVIVSGSTLYLFLFATDTMENRIGVILIGGLFGAIIGGIIGGVIGYYSGLLSGAIAIALAIGFVVGSVLGAMAGDLFYDFFLKKKLVDPEEVEFLQWKDQALRAERDGDLKNAVYFYKSIMSSPFNKAPEATAFKIGQIFEESIKNFGESIYWYRKTISLALASPAGDENLFCREAREGLDRIKALLKAKERPTVEGLVEAKKLIEAEQFEEAEKLLSDLEKIHPDNAEVDYLKGHFHLFHNLPGMAVTCFSTALEKDPAHVLAAWYLAESVLDQRQYMDAHQRFEDYLILAADDEEEKERIALAKEKMAWIRNQLESNRKTQQGLSD